MPLRRHRQRLIAAAIALAVAVGGVAGSPARADITVESLRLPTHVGVETFLVAHPDAAVSGASRQNADMADKAGVVPPPTPGFELNSAVIVKLRDGAGAGALALPGRWAKEGAVEPLADLPNYRLVRVGTVREAAALAEALRADAAVAEAYLDIRRPQPLRDLPTDPNFPAQWHLLNTVAPFTDINVVPVWNAGRTGTGVTVGVLEDGWHVTHPDIAANYNAAASQTTTATNSHGTAVAGLVAALANNGLGGVGVAYTAQVSRLVRGSASATAAAFAFRNDLNAIKNNSWGPLDNGLVTTMASVERDAIASAVANGRDGLGTIFVWAAGNGGVGDRVDYDPYASSRYTIAIGSLTDLGQRAPNNESGSSMFGVAPSSGQSGVNRFIYTTSGPTGYTASFGGSSAASPIAAGVIALMLQARPDLTWRDVQHILARTSFRCDPDNPGWTTNGAGRWVSYDYGFGLVDAAAAVSLAQVWTPVRPEVVRSAVQIVSTPIPDNDATGLMRTITVADDVRVEAVEVELNVLHTTVGDLRIELTSPSGTTSLLAAQRFDPTDNYINYVFTSVRHWDERGAGDWTLRIADLAAGDAGTWSNWRLRVYGTPVCRADWNEDGAVNSTDLSAFITSWLASLQQGTLEADFNGDETVNSSDISAFVTAWLAALQGGC